jgi:hypothetical protein
MRGDGGEAAQAAAYLEATTAQRAIPAGRGGFRHADAGASEKVGDSATLICSPRGLRNFADTPAERVRASLTRLRGYYGVHTLGVFLGGGLCERGRQLRRR